MTDNDYLTTKIQTVPSVQIILPTREQNTIGSFSFHQRQGEPKEMQI